MERDRPIVVRPDEGGAPSGPPTPGMDRRQLFDDDDCWVGWVRTDAGLPGGWHHHGEHDSHIYVLRGTVTIEFGPGGREKVTARAGDYIFNPARIVHREITAPNEPAELFVVRVGTGPQTVNLESPDSESAHESRMS